MLCTFPGNNFTMDEQTIKKLLEGVHQGNVDVEDALADLKGWTSCQIDSANIDLHRKLRTGIPEVIFSNCPFVYKCFYISEN